MLPETPTAGYRARRVLSLKSFWIFILRQHVLQLLMMNGKAGEEAGPERIE